MTPPPVGHEYKLLTTTVFNNVGRGAVCQAFKFYSAKLKPILSALW